VFALREPTGERELDGLPELAGGFGLPSARALASRIEQSVVRRIASLPAQTRQLLFTAAAEPVGEVNLLLQRDR
jgi:hypothetical protein